MRASCGPVSLRPSCTCQRSEEHTSELQSRLHLVCRLLLEKKKQQAAHQNAHIIFGAVVDPSLKGKVKITVIATGFEAQTSAPAAGSVAHKPLETAIVTVNA